MPRVPVILLIFVASCWGQTPAPDPNPAKPARVEGSVSSPGGEPIRRATLSLSFGDQTYTTETSAQGNFVFEDVAPGRYSLSAQRSGYVGVYYSTTVVLEPGQSMTGISMKMTPQGILAGRVIDDDGEPFPNIRVTLYRPGHVPDGSKRLVPSANAVTDADGAFVIGNLQAGTYFAAAQPQNAQPSTVHRRGEVSYVTTYYPDATAIADAIPIPVTAGNQSRGFVVRMRRVPVFRITGRAVIAATGVAASNPTINLIPKGESAIPGAAVQAPLRDGAFEFDRVLPGIYLLQATPDGMSGSGILVGRQEITVNRGDVEDVLLPIVQAADVAGRITVEGGAAGPLPQIPIALGSLEGISYGLSNGIAAADGTFLIRSVEQGPVVIAVPRLPPNMYLKAVRYGGRDVTGMPVDLYSGAAGLLEIVLSPKAAMVTGVVHDSNGAPLPSAWAALWNPADPLSVMQSFQRVMENGRFFFASLKPGDYKLLTFATAMFSTENVYDWIDKFADRALTVKVEEGSQQALDPPVITPD